MAARDRTVVIAGGGFAALEAMIALRRLAGGRVELVLLCPTPDLAYPPLSVVEPFGLGEAPLRPGRDRARPRCRAARRCGGRGRHRPARVAHALRRRDHLRLAAGDDAEPHEAVPGALTFRGSADRPAFEDLLASIDAGRVKSVVFAVPAGTAWPLPLYELALLDRGAGRFE